MAQKMTKVPEAHVKRATALLTHMKDSPELVASSRKTPAAVIRVALELGLAALEAKYRAPGKVAAG